MDCDLFRNRLKDFVEGSLPSDVRNSMKKHMEECEACRNIYEYEKSADEMLYDYMRDSDIEFSNIRPNIISSIDKSRYKNSFFNRLYYAFKKYGKRYVASAALVAFLTVSVVQIFKGNGFFALGTGVTNGAPKMSKAEKNMKSYNTVNNDSQANGGNPYVPTAGVTLPRFIKQPAAIDNVTPDSDHSKKSPDGSITATVIGKGEYVQEEGIANILLIYKNNEESLIKLTDNSDQLTPKLVEWKDNNTLYVIVGYGYGTVTTGGNLYTLNIKTLEVKPLYIGEKCKKEVSSIKISDKGLLLYVNVYDADAVHYKTETVELRYSQID